MGFGVALLVSLSLATPIDEEAGLPHRPEDIRRFREGAERGDPWAQASLAWLYDNGVGVPQDFAEAVKWYRKAAEQGIAESQNNLAIFYFEGRGVRRDYSMAYFWANLASTLAQNPVMIELGFGKDREKWFELRDEAAARLSAPKLAAMQKRCRQWLAAFEKRKARK